MEKNSDGRITGIIAQSTEDDHFIRYNANKGVLLACGGFPGNPYMMEQLVPGGTTGAIIGILDLGVHIIGVVLGVFCRPLGLVAVGVDHLHAVLVLHYGADKFNHLGRLVDPGLDHALITLAGGVTGDLAQQLGTIHLDALFLSAKAVHGTHPVTGILHIAVLLDDTEVQALGWARSLTLTRLPSPRP